MCAKKIVCLNKHLTKTAKKKKGGGAQNCTKLHIFLNIAIIQKKCQKSFNMTIY